MIPLEETWMDANRVSAPIEQYEDEDKNSGFSGVFIVRFFLRLPGGQRG